MFNQVAANIAAQQQASLFEAPADEFALVSQDVKGNDVPAAPAPAEPAADYSLEAYWAGSASESIRRSLPYSRIVKL